MRRVGVSFVPLFKYHYLYEKHCDLRFRYFQSSCFVALIVSLVEKREKEINDS